MDIESANEAKANFDSIYEQPTPHAYYGHLGRLDYSICDEIRPFCVRADKLLRERGQPVRMLDIGCSYGINATTIQHNLSFALLNRMLDLNVSRDPAKAPADMREALRSVGTPVEIECCGMDVSGPAIEFAQQAGIHTHGIATDLEADGAELTDEQRAIVSRTNLLLCTGAIGYVTDRTFKIVLDAIGDGCKDVIALMTVLRVFDTDPITSALADRGLASTILPDVLLPQRRFEDAREQREIVDVLGRYGLDATPERTGRHFARMLVAAHPTKIAALEREMLDVANSRPTLVRDVETATDVDVDRPAQARTSGASG